MRTPTYLLLSLAIAGGVATGCSSAGTNDLAFDPNEQHESLDSLASKVSAGTPMARNVANREYVNILSDLLGEKLPLDLVKSWTVTTQFSGFDAVPWMNLDTKAIRDRTETIETILDKVLVSTRVMKCSVTTTDQLGYAACAKSIVEPFAARAFGRPLTPTETTSLAQRYEEGVTLAKTMLTDPKAIFTDGVRTALGSILLSPQLVSRIEAPPTPEFVGERELDAFELASRLSFMFTASVADDELWSAAETGALTNPDVLRAQTVRLLETKTESFVENFMGQWFDFRAYDSSDPASLEHAMFDESVRTLSDVVKEGLPVTSILQPGFTYVTADLAKHYSLPGSFTSQMTRVETVERGGILQQGSWLSLSASALKTSPIHRGRLVQDRLLCKVVAPPDSALFEKIQEVSASIPATASVRERVEAHRNAGEACAGCHTYMDPIGIGLESFDMHGKLRRAYADTGRPVETQSNLLGKPFQTAAEMNGLLAELPAYQRCAAEKLTIYAVRRIVDSNTDADTALINYLVEPINGKPPSIREMVLRLVASNAFRKVSYGGKV